MGTYNVLVEYFIHGKKSIRSVLSESTSFDGLSLLDQKKAITRVILPHGIAKLKEECFHGCERLQSVVLPSTLTEIERGAFYECKSLREISLPNGLRTIADRVFPFCNQLRCVAIPGSVESIGMWAFGECAGLRYVRFEAGEKSARSIPSNCFRNCSNLAYVELPSSVERIETGAFENCKSLKAVVMPSVRSIQTWAFAGCDSLNTAITGTALEDISNQEFENEDNPHLERKLVCDIDTDHSDPFVRVVKYQSRKETLYEVVAVPLSEEGIKNLLGSITTLSECRAAALEEAGEANPDETASIDLDSMQTVDYLKLLYEGEAAVWQLTEELAMALSQRKQLATAIEKRKEKSSGLSLAERLSSETTTAIRKAELSAINSGARLGRDAWERIGTIPGDDPRNEPQPTKPQEPQYEKPGLFNKKKIEERNAAAKLSYDNALAKYEEEMANRDNRIQKYEEALRLFHDRMQAEISSQIDTMNVGQPNEAHDTDPGTVDSLLTVLLRASDCMIEDRRARLQEAAKVLATAYSLDLVYPKYRNLVAMSTIYEYFATGRCSTLQGADGAYNLYESELRANAIIGKLDVISEKIDTVIDSLNEIKANQFALYTVVKRLDASVKDMSKTLDAVLEETRSAAGTLEELSDKADQIVRSSRESAYWAKKNAELTESLGVLIALK